MHFAVLVDSILTNLNTRWFPALLQRGARRRTLEHLIRGPTNEIRGRFGDRTLNKKLECKRDPNHAVTVFTLGPAPHHRGPRLLSGRVRPTPSAVVLSRGGMLVASPLPLSLLLLPSFWDHVPTSPSSTQRLGVCGLCDAQTAQRALCTCSRLLLTDRCYRRSVTRIVELWKHALVELRRRSMSTEATRQRKRVASLWDWAMPGLVMRVHGDCARNSLKQVETHIARDDTSATLLKCREITTDGIQHQIAVLSKYQIPCSKRQGGVPRAVAERPRRS